MKIIIKHLFLIIIIAWGSMGVHAQQYNHVETISSCVELRDKINQNPSGKFILTKNVSCMDNDSFTPIDKFSGYLDGKEYTISDITIIGQGSSIGIFKNISGTFKNLKLENIYVKSTESDDSFVKVGGLTAQANQAKFSNIELTDIHVEGYARFMGGLIGSAGSNVIIDNVSANVFVDGVSLRNIAVGGLVGFLSDANIIKSQTSGTVKATAASLYDNEAAGGLVGILTSSLNTPTFIHESFSSSDVISSDNSAGGLIGTLEFGEVHNSYATGKVRGNLWIGGLVGVIHKDGKIYNSYAVGEVINPGYGGTGGLVGWQREPSIIKGSYWDKENTKQDLSEGSDDKFGKSEVEMKQQSTFEDWSFEGDDAIWAMEPNGYPYLRSK